MIDVVGPTVAYVECGVLKIPEDEAMARRLRWIAEGVGEVIAELAPGVVALEAAFHGVNAASALKLGQARGAIMLVAATRDLEVHEYPPAMVKKAVVGHGRATKAEIQARVQLLCRLRRAPSADAADALAIALCHAHGGPSGPGRGRLGR